MESERSPEETIDHERKALNAIEKLQDFLNENSEEASERALELVFKIQGEIRWTEVYQDTFNQFTALSLRVYAAVGRERLAERLRESEMEEAEPRQAA